MAKQRVLQNNRLLWVDASINENDADTQHALEKLQTIVYHIDLFTQIDDCLRFLLKVKNEQALIITSGSLGRDLVKKIHHLTQVDTIYIFCGNPDRHQTWANTWSKITGVYDRIGPICKALRIAVKQTNEDFTPISFITKSEVNPEGSTVDLNRLEPSFMYTTLFKRILLRMKHEPDEKKAIVNFCREQYAGNPTKLQIVKEFSRDYRPDKAIWWYTRECFIYHMLNRSLRLLESDIIVDMGFFIHDLHRQLERLHQEQFVSSMSTILTLYRGQALSIDDFTKLKKSIDGLLAFNCFLSTSRDKSLALTFARKSSQRNELIGIFFVLTIDPKIRSAIFADVEPHSYFENENEVVFTMHTVFRIGSLLDLDGKGRLFEVRLTMTSDDDPELFRLTNYIDQETRGATGWQQLGRVLLSTGHVNKAEELYLALLKQNLNERDQGISYHQLGWIKDRQGDYSQALCYYGKALDIDEKRLDTNHPSLATSYNNIGQVYKSMGEYARALSYYHRALTIYEKSLPVNHPSLGTSYNNIGQVYKSMGEYSRALSYLNKAFAIEAKSLPANHPSLATSYNNIGLLYQSMGEYSRALSYLNKAFSIREKSLPTNHPSLATSYNNIGLVYDSMGEYSRALLHLNKALVIRETSLPPNHPSLATSYNNIGAIYDSMGEYSRALSYYNKALPIYEQSFPGNHPHVAQSYNNIGVTYYNLGEYSKASSFLQRARDIRKHSLPVGHSDIKSSEKWLELTKKRLA